MAGVAATEEYLDLVDRLDRVTGRMRRAEVHASGRRDFRGVTGFVRNSTGQLLVMRRHAAKALLPNCLDASVTGHVTSGETYDHTFARELNEELGWGVQDVRWRRLGELTPHRDGSYCFYHVYEIAADETPPYNRDDFSAHYWLAPAQAAAWLDSGEAASSALSVSLRRFYLPP
jgi:isopentenyl-diphosphate delta-isomerase